METKTIYEQVIDFLKTHNGKTMRGTFYQNSKPLKRKEMTPEQKEEAILYSRWRNSLDFKILEKYAGKPIEKVPEEYREKIEKLRSYGLGIKEKNKKTIYEQVIDFLETHDGKIMKGCFLHNNKALKRSEMTPEQREEINLYGRWRYSNECRILERYTGVPIQKIPKEYREKIEKLRSYGLGLKEKNTIDAETIYNQVIEHLESHDGKLMRRCFYESGNTRPLKKDKLTPEQVEEVKLYYRWKKSEVCKTLEKYAGKPIENVPEEYREKIEKLRSYGLGMKEKSTKSTYEQVIDFLETHNGKMMRSCFYKNSKPLKRREMTLEQKREVSFYSRWRYSQEYKILKEYEGQPIEKVPEEYRKKIEKLRSYGLGMKGKSTRTTYEQVIEHLETHSGKIMRGNFYKNRKPLKREEVTPSQHKEVKIYAKWKYSKERKILEEYAGQPIENVPEEYRERIEKLRSYGLGLKKSKISEAKQKRDKAKDINDKAIELEEQAADELKKVSNKFKDDER